MYEKKLGTLRSEREIILGNVGQDSIMRSNTNVATLLGWVSCEFHPFQFTLGILTDCFNFYS